MTNEKLYCFADDCKNFWKNFSEWNKETFEGIYYAKNKGTLYDPDSKSSTLYEYHKKLWNKQYSKYNKQKKWNLKNINNFDKNQNYLDVNGIQCSSDSIISIYWHWKNMQGLMKTIATETEDKIKGEIIQLEKYKEEYIQTAERFGNSQWKDNNILKKFIWLYLQKSNTIGGFIVFPRNSISVNSRRGNYNGQIKDRFDLTLECIRRAYIQGEFSVKEKINPLFGVDEQEKKFFNMFGSFENYIDFFFLQDWVDDNYKVKNLLNNEPLDDYSFCESNPLPTETNEWWTFYKNLMDRLDKRNTRIKLSL